MNQYKWDHMSSSEKYEYLKSFPIIVKDESRLDLTAKVGAVDAVKTYFTAYVGKVQLSYPCLTAKEAIAKAEESMKSYKEDAENARD